MRVELRHQTVGINMTPMIDVVFLLIVFFLVSSHLAQRENRIPVELPDAISGQTAGNPSQRRVTLTLQADGQIWLAGQSIPVQELTEQLRGRQAATGHKSLELRVRCDRSVPYQRVEPVLRAAAEAEVWDLSFAVLRQGREHE